MVQRVHKLLLVTALASLTPLAPAAAMDAPQTGLPESVQRHIDQAYLIMNGDVSQENLPSTLYLVDDKSFASPMPMARQRPAQPAVKAFDQFIYLGTNTVSAYALETSEGIILFDTLNTTAEATQYIEGGLRRVGLDPARIRYIVITHGHADHYGGAKYLQEKYRARVLMSDIDWDIVLKEAAAGTARVPPPNRDLSIADGQKLTLGKTTVSFHLTPGHTPGTISTIIPVTDRGRPHVISFIGGTGLNQVKEPSKGGGKIMRDSLRKFARVSAEAGADVVLASHPFLDDSWRKAGLVNDGKAGRTSPWVTGKDAVLRYYASAIEAVFAIEEHDRLRSAQAASSAEAAHKVSAFAGRWQMNADKTKMGRMGPTGQNIVRAPTFTWIFTPEGPGLRMDVYTEYPQAAPTRTMTLIPDGKLRQCDSANKTACLTRGGDPSEQTYVYHQIDPHLIARVFYIKGEVYEYSHYAVSKDGKTFTAVSWGPDTPEYHNIQVFERQQ